MAAPSLRVLVLAAAVGLALTELLGVVLHCICHSVCLEPVHIVETTAMSGKNVSIQINIQVCRNE